MTGRQFYLVVTGLCLLAVVVGAAGNALQLGDHPVNLTIGGPVLLVTTAAIAVVWRVLSRR